MKPVEKAKKTDRLTKEQVEAIQIIRAQGLRIGNKDLCPSSGLRIKPTRLFGHQDAVGKDHHGAKSRWEKQRRRQGKLSRAARAMKAQEARRAP